jgi:hypothetical protein
LHFKNNINFAKPKKVLQNVNIVSHIMDYCALGMVGANSIFVAEYGTFKGFKSIGVVRSIPKKRKKKSLEDETTEINLSIIAFFS